MENGMENGDGHSRLAVQEYSFDVEQYIQKRLREIDDLDERRFAKEVLLQGLGKISRCMEEKYKRLERRILDEVEIAANQYESVMTVVRREDYDPINGTLFPVVAADVEPEKLAEELSDEKERFVETIFLEANGEEQRRFEEIKTFPGTIGQAKAAFTFRRAERYRNAVERLYQVFLHNGILWQTVNTGYLDKFYDVFVHPSVENPVDAENLADADTSADIQRPGGKRQKGKDGLTKNRLKEIKIQYGEYGRYVRRGMMPLWNMEYLPFSSTEFMMPCTDGIYYEHEFSLKDKVLDDGYLVCPNEDILEIRHEEGRIIVKSQKEIFQDWEILHLVQAQTIRSIGYDAPLLTNHKRDSFIRRYSEKRGARLMTKMDLFRRIMELDIREFIEVEDYEIREKRGDVPKAEGMNWFVQDEVFPMESRRVLFLIFREKQPGHYLNDSMVRFVVSQLQLEISEYCCVGVIR